ncbi:hypothetical protein YC2023_081782 [Brassica napus]
MSCFPLVSQLLIVSNSGTEFPSIRGLRGQKARYLRDVSRWANDKDAELLRLGYAILFILSFFFPSKFSFLHLFCLKEIEEVNSVKPEVVSWSPRIIVLHNFLSSEECEYLKAIARPHLQVSTVVDIKTGKLCEDKLWSNGDWHRVSKGRLQSRYLRTNFILDLYNTRADLRKKVHLAIDKYALRGLRSLAVARQTVPEKSKRKSSGDPWEFVGGLPLFDPPRHDSDQLAISSETRLKLGMGSNMYPYHQLLYLDKKAIRESLGNQMMVDRLIETGDSEHIFQKAIMCHGSEEVEKPQSETKIFTILFPPRCESILVVERPGRESYIGSREE